MSTDQGELLPVCTCYLRDVMSDKSTPLEARRRQAREWGHAKSCPLAAGFEPLEPDSVQAMRENGNPWT